MSSTLPTVSDSLPHIPGYTVTEQIYKGLRTAVYRAVSAEKADVVIKLLQQAYPTFNDLAHFRNQYAITKNLPIPSIVRPLSIDRWENSYALVMEDFGGLSIQQYIQDNSLTIAEILSIATQMADVLHHLCQHQVVHKDIKPANILIHPTSKQIKLIDFSIASLLPKEIQESQSPNRLEGTLTYLAPEQTGRMNRGIDYRTDFYSLGVTLYELLTGELPFLSTDPLELVHCHIAKAPIPPHQINPDIPLVLSQIVLKLMAKNAEDRYQSALGLKHDLEQCLFQWKDIGEIVSFKLGQRDVSDRFLIPEKLYGREREVKQLLDAFERVSQGNLELMLVSGFSGIGKTAVVNEVHKPITYRKGYFIKGKFDQFNRNIPFSAFVYAFRSLMGQLLGEPDIKIAQWKKEILKAVGENGQVIVDVIPELERIIGVQPSVPDLSGSAAQNRFKLVFGKFVQVFTTPAHPLVIFLDDLQWADSASLNLLKLMMSEAASSTKSGYLLILGAYRDNEIFPAHPLMLTLDELKNRGEQVNTLNLAPLVQSDIVRLVADTLLCEAEVAAPLAHLVYQKAKGNPFFSTQFLQSLHRQKCIDFNIEVGYWQCDLAKVKQLALTDDVVELMVSRLQSLPKNTQSVLKLAACVGNRFDLETLSVVCNGSQDDVATDLWPSLLEGLVIPESEIYRFFQESDQGIQQSGEVTASYRFLHDRVQQAAYSLIPDSQKQKTHLEIGRLLRQQMEKEDNADYLFSTLNHLNEGAALIVDPVEQHSLATLNLLGSQRARDATAYEAAGRYATNAMALLEDGSWHSNPEFTLRLYEVSTEVAYLATEFAQAEQLIQEIFQNTSQPIERMKSYELLVQVFISTDRQLQAIETGLEALQQLGIPLVEQSDWQKDLPVLPDSIDLTTRPQMMNPAHLSALRILITITPPTHHVKPELFPTVVLTMIELCEKEGFSELTAYVYGIYGLLLEAVVGDSDMAHRSGQLAIALLDYFPGRMLHAKVNMLFAVFVCATKDPGQSTLPILKQGIEIGLDVADIEYVSYSIMAYFSHLILIGIPLEQVYTFKETYFSVLEQFKQEHCIEYAKLWLEMADDLTKREQTGLIDQENKLSKVAYFKKTHNQQCLFSLHLTQLINCYLLEDWESAVLHGKEAQDNQEAAFGSLLTAAHTFYHSLALLASLHGIEEDNERNAVLSVVASNQAKLQLLSEHAPANFSHKFNLVRAEVHRITNCRGEAVEYYSRAISDARENGYLQEEAIANELAAKLYLDWNNEKVAAVYMQEAYYCYARWGAQAKTNDLESRYPNLLKPILQQVSQTPNLFETRTTIISPQTSFHTTTKTTQSTGISDTLDVIALLRTSQVLSRTIQLDDLLQQLTTIMLQYSGGDSCMLFMPSDENADQWQAQITATADSVDTVAVDTAATALEGNPNLPARLIQYVKNTRDTVIVNDLQTNLPVIDDYLSQKQPKSLLCLPLLNQAKVIGILYVTNQLSSGVFTEERLSLLNFLCPQAAISLENARLYQQAQDYAQQLEQSQLTIVQSEKMSALGSLVAGVAHEINNPVGCILGNVGATQHYISDLLGLLDLYAEELPNPSEKLKEELEIVEIEYVREDLPKLIRAMKDSGDRIKSISKSLRTFSRADTDEKQSFNLNEGIESTVLILRHRLKPNEQRPAIEVIADYADIPAIECFPGQLNQVFMNILANAIDALDEVSQQRSFDENKANVQQITIQTRLESNQVKITFTDNGPGMPESVKSKIFDHLFTTKTVGKGTGLGLAIAKQIIVEAHGGTIDVKSQPGAGTEFCIRLPR